MNKIIDYVMIMGTSGQEVSEDVRTFIKKNWQPYGPPFVAGSWILQAMVKYENP